MSRTHTRTAKARLAACGVLLAAVCAATPGQAEERITALRLLPAVEDGHMLPTTSTQQRYVSLELLMPLLSSSLGRLLAGVAPRALTQQVFAMPEVMSVGLTSSLRAEF